MLKKVKIAFIGLKGIKKLLSLFRAGGFELLGVLEDDGKVHGLQIPIPIVNSIDGFLQLGKADIIVNTDGRDIAFLAESIKVLDPVIINMADERERFLFNRFYRERQSLEKLRKENTRLARKLGESDWAINKTDKALKKLYRQLDAKNKELFRLDQMKSDFVSTVSHELRTPLAIIREGVALLRDRVLGEINESQTRRLESIIKNVDRLTNIINDLLDISKLERGNVELARTEFDIKGLVEETAEDFGQRSFVKEIELSVDIGKEDCRCFGDKGMIRQVVTNLMGNAIKFTPKGGKIILGCRDKGYNVEVFVQDTGPGISEDEKQKLFKKFQQFTQQSTGGEKGTGLGLAISRQIVELHGGRIWVETKKGTGSRFCFTIPKYRSLKTILPLMINERIEKVSKTSDNAHLSLVIVNINEIGDIRNDYGLDAVGKILASVKGIVANCLTRSDDTILPEESERILLLLPYTERQGARVVCEKIREAVSLGWVVYKGQQVNVSVSFKVASFPEDGKIAEDLLRYAEQSFTKEG